MALTTATKVYSIHTIAVIFCLISTQLPVGYGYIASVLANGDGHKSGDGGTGSSPTQQRRETGNAIGLHSGESGSESELEGNPTYTPYVSARVLSNIPKFFQHLRENLEALQHDEGIEREEDDGGAMFGGGDAGDFEESRFDGGHGGHEETGPEIYDKQLTSKLFQPAAMAQNGRMSNIRSFVRHPSEQENYLRRAHNYNPSWLYTNLGLGRRRRGR